MVGAGDPEVVGTGETVAVGVAESPGTAAAQLGRVMVLPSSVTAPLRASSRPTTVAPVVAVMLSRASTEPWKVELVPRVAELPTWKKTLQACAPLVSTIELPVPVVRVEPALITNTDDGLLAPSRVSGTVPLSSSEEVEP